MLFKNIKIFFSYCFKTRWIFKLPKKNKYLVFDGQHIPFFKYIKKKNTTILYRRGEEINFFIFLKCLLKFKLTTLDYCKEFIKQVSPKLILTAFDYHTIFYKLSECTGVKTLMLQKGQRGLNEGIYKNPKNIYFPQNSKKRFFVDYVFVYNDSVKKFYSDRIRGNFFISGSFENNFTQLDAKKQKKKAVFISNYSPDEISPEKRENEDIIVSYLSKLCRERKIQFNLLPRFRKNPTLLRKEINFYKKIIDGNVNFILSKKKTSYELLQNYKYIFSSYSTLAKEFFSKGFRTGFLMFKSKNNPINTYRFGSYEKFKKKGPFWTSSFCFNKKETLRVFKYVTETSNKKWNNQVKLFRNKILNFDFDNKQFKKILKKFNNYE